MFIRNMYMSTEIVHLYFKKRICVSVMDMLCADVITYNIYYYKIKVIHAHLSNNTFISCIYDVISNFKSIHFFFFFWLLTWDNSTETTKNQWNLIGTTDKWKRSRWFLKRGCEDFYNVNGNRYASLKTVMLMPSEIYKIKYVIDYQVVSMYLY